VTPEQALQLLANVVAGTRALPHEVDAMRAAVAVLGELVNRDREPDDEPDDARSSS
jgi:hypothetical protein